jgi:ABC-type multidrug transport system fused ATPase/permease subunit
VAHAVGYSIHSQTLSSFYMAPNSTASLDSQSAHPLNFYLGVYVAFSAASSILGTWRYFYIYTGSIRASRILFDKLCFTLLRTPLRWMDTVPLGRILNRFTADFNVVDSRLSNNFSFGANNVFRLIGVIAAGLVSLTSPSQYSHI